MAAQWLIPILGLELKKYTVERDGQDPTPPCTPDDASDHETAGDQISSANNSMQITDSHEHESLPRAVSPGPLPVHESSKAMSPCSTPVPGASEPVSGGRKLSSGISKGLESGDPPTTNSKRPSQAKDATHGQPGPKRKIPESTSSQHPKQPSFPSPTSVPYLGCHHHKRQKG